MMRISFALGLLCLCSLSFAAEPAHASIRKDLNLPAEPLGSALQDLAKVYDFQLLFHTEIVKDLKTSGAAGSLTSDEALTKVLFGTGLTFKYLDPQTVTVYPASANFGQSNQSDAASESSKGGGKSSSQNFRVAQLDQAGSRTSTVSATTETTANNPNGGPALSEIIVTAQKKSENLIDVPVPVTVLSPQTLLDRNQVSIENYFTSVPGLRVVMGGDGGNSPEISIRGLSTGIGLVNPTVGIVVDDVPFGGSAALTSGAYVPDFDPSDLASIEVLRGPQGTLYGASTLGGLIKYVTIDPSTDAVSGRIEAGTSAVYKGDEPGYNFRAAVNVPLSDTFAIRASGFTRKDPGYIDNVFAGQRDVNQTEVDGGHLAALWRPSTTLSLKLSALYQETRAHGAPYVGSSLSNSVPPSGLGDLQQEAVPGSNFFDSKLQVYSATLKAKLGTVELTSLSAYNVNALNDSADHSFNFGGPSGPSQLFGVEGSPLQQHMENRKFTQEIRLSSSIGSTVDWLLGGFYDHERNDPSNDTIWAANTQTGTVVGEVANAASPYTYSEDAAFTNLTFHLTDRFDIQLGARESHITQDYAPVWTGPLIPIAFGFPSPLVPPPATVSANAFTYLFTPAFKVSPDFMVYARLASGYRPGGDNINNTDKPLPSYAPDKTQNYEIGAKGDFLEHKFSFDASIYYIDWKDIQIQTISPATGTALYINGTRAKSQGIELSGESRPFQGLTISAWVALSDAVLTQALPIYGPGALVGASGSRLPLSSRVTGNLSIDQKFPLTSRMSGFGGASVSYIGDRLDNFETTAERIYHPGYAKTDLRAGLEYESWKVNFFVNNVTDKRAVSEGGDPGTNGAFVFVVIQPRTAGVSITKAF